MPSPKQAPSEVLAQLREATLVPDLAYHPTEEQRRLKAKFWLAFRNNPITEETMVTPGLVEDMTGKSVQKWLSDPAFWAWFGATKDTTKENLEAAAEKASELAMFYLDPSVPFNDNARVQLIKYVLEFSGRSPPSRKEIKWHDKEIQDLSEEQLDALIAKLTKRALPSP